MMDSRHTVGLFLAVVAIAGWGQAWSAAPSATQTSSAKVVRVLAPNAVVVSLVGRGTSEMKGLAGMIYRERNGRTEEVQNWISATPSKPEYSQWLTFKVTLSLDNPEATQSSQWALKASQFVLTRPGRDTTKLSDGSYECLSIINPMWHVRGQMWEQFPKDLLVGALPFATNKLPNYTQGYSMYQAIGLKSIRPTMEVEFYLAFPAAAAREQELLLTIK